MLLDVLRTNGVISTSDNSKTMAAPTGFTAIDLLGSTLETDIEGKPYLNRGISSKFYMKTGQSGQGKTTLGIQECSYGVEWWNKMYSQEPSDLIMIDSEDNTTIDRIMQLTGWDYEYLNKHFSMRKDINIKNIYNFILKLIDAKQKNKDFYYVDSPILNVDGKPLKVWATTYVLIDSIAAIKSGVGLESVERDKTGEIKETEISGNIDAMREAKINTDFIMKMKPMCQQYGIYIGLINHITQEQKLSMFDVPKRYLVHLKPGEKLRGGFELIYQAYGIDNNRMKEKLDERNPVYGDFIKGFISEFSYIKSKNHGEGIPYRMVLDKDTGYKPELSDFEYLYSVDFGIGGAGASMYMLILPEIKFSRKSLLEKCKEYPELARAIQFTAKYYMVYDLLLGKTEKPDLSVFTSMSLEERLRWIYQYSNAYAGYDKDGVSDSMADKLMEVKTNVNNNFKTDFSNSYIDELTLLLLTPDENGTRYIPQIGFDNFVNPGNIDIKFKAEDGFFFHI